MTLETLLPMIKEALQVRGLLKEIYGDALKPGVSQVGKALGTVLGLGTTVLLPIYWVNERSRMIIEKNLEKFRLSLEGVPEPEIIPVRPEVGVPILEKLMYVTDDELSDLYINLLSKASTAETAKFVHPSFVGTVNNLSPDEAILLKEFGGEFALPIITARFVQKHPEKQGTYRDIEDIVGGLKGRVALAFPANVDAYFINLKRLGILEIRDFAGSVESPAHRHDPNENENDSETVWRFSLIGGKAQATDFGALFLDACLKKLLN